jgi:hypothetical protein
MNNEVAALQKELEALEKLWDEADDHGRPTTEITRRIETVQGRLKQAKHMAFLHCLDEDKEV